MSIQTGNATGKIRLDQTPSQIIDREKIVTFTFNGKKYTAYEGDTIASALAAGGVTVFSRSFKYHRKRGLLCVSGNCPNCLVQVGDEPNVRSCKMPVVDGMIVQSQNAWPSLDMDVMSLTQMVARFLPAGFYYKTFMHPKMLWPLYERLLRHSAGLGKLDPASDTGCFDKIYQHADVAVVGAGPAGMRAALAAAAAGASVILLDEQPEPGGYLRHTVSDIDGKAGYVYAREIAARVKTHEHIKLLANTSVFGIDDHNWIAAVMGDRLIKLRAKALVIATGAYALPSVFENNDLPGIMLGSGIQRLMHLWGVSPGKQAVVASANRRGLQVALDLLAAGLTVSAVADMRLTPDTDLVQQLERAGVRVLPGMRVEKATGHNHIDGVLLCSLENPSVREQFDCDLLALSTGFTPANGLLFQAGGKLDWDENLNEFVPKQLPSGVFAAGEVTGTHTLMDIEHEGKLAGLQAALAAGYSDDALSEQAANLSARLQQQQAQRTAWTYLPIGQQGGKKDFVCLCEDVTRQDIKQSIDEGYDSIELLKRYSTVSMGPCQGKMCNMAVMHLCAHDTDRTIAETGTTTSRPPAKPVTLGTLGGRLMEPVRFMPMHDWHLSQGAQMMNAGLWKRPEYYSDPVAEVRAVRERVGLIDVSTLGKLHLHGADVPTLLERLYTNRWQKLGVGGVRYGVMTNEEGVVFDDGVTAHLADDFYYMTTTSGGATRIYEWIEWWLQSAWNLDVRVFNATDLRAAMNLAGPHARDVLTKVAGDVNLSNNAFPYMHVRQAAIAGVPALLMRIGFTGELSYEIHVPSGYGLHVWKALMEAGEAFGIVPFGVEAQRILRLEKAHIIIGQDTDALTNPIEAGMGWAVKLEKTDFLGKPSLSFAQEHGAAKRLVGFEMPDGTLPEEANQIVRPGRGPIGLEIIGRITSVRYSPTLNQVIGLCWLPPDMSSPGQEFSVRVRGDLHTGRVIDMPFYDPDGTKLRG